MDDAPYPSFDSFSHDSPPNPPLRAVEPNIHAIAQQQNPLADPNNQLLTQEDMRPKATRIAERKLKTMTWFERNLSNKQMARFLDKMQVSEARTDLEYHEQALHAFTEVKLKGMKEWYDSQLITLSLQVRNHVSAYAMDQYNVLVAKTVQAEARFLDAIRAKKAVYAANRDMPEVVALFEGELITLTRDYINVIRQLLARNESAINNRIGELRS